jgi:Family of unknown function (DUF6178)
VPNRPPQRTSAALPASPSATLNALLEDPHALSTVRSMPPVLLHRTISNIGMYDTAELVALATPQQIREVLDLELWRGDRLNLDDALDWLHFLTTLPDDVRVRDIAALDIELLGFVLKQHLRIYLNEEDNVPEPAEGALHGTPDGWFTLEILADHETTVERVVEVIDALYIDDQEGTRSLLQNLMWELPSELEEYAYRWRTARLQDLGFGDPLESLLVYAYLDPSTVHPDEGTVDRPLATASDPVQVTDLAPLMASFDSFWSRAIASVDDKAVLEQLGQALLYLGNRCLTADRVDPADMEAAQESLQALRARLSLGLEHLCGGELERAPAVLRGVALLRVARVGFSLPLLRRRRIMPLYRRGQLGPPSGKLAWLDPPLDAQIAAIVAGRPGHHDVSTAERRPFASLDDLNAADRAIDHALAAAAIVGRLHLGPALQQRGTFGDRFRTALLNGLLEREGAVDRDALRRFIEAHVEEERLDPAVLTAGMKILPPGAAPAEEEVVRGWIAALEASVAGLASDDLDLRFVDGLVLTTAR